MENFDYKIGSIVTGITYPSMLSYFEFREIGKTNYYISYGRVDNVLEYILYNDDRGGFRLLDSRLNEVSKEDLLVKHLQILIKPGQINTIEQILISIPEVSTHALEKLAEGELINILMRGKRYIDKDFGAIQTDLGIDGLICYDKRGRARNLLYTYPGTEIPGVLFNNSTTYKHINLNEGDGERVLHLTPISNFFDSGEVDVMKYEGIEEGVHDLIVYKYFDTDLVDYLRKGNWERYKLYYKPLQIREASRALIDILNLMNDGYHFSLTSLNAYELEFTIYTMVNADRIFNDLISEIQILFEEEYFESQPKQNIIFDKYTQYLFNTKRQKIGGKTVLVLTTLSLPHYVKLILEAIKSKFSKKPIEMYYDEI